MLAAPRLGDRWWVRALTGIAGWSLVLLLLVALVDAAGSPTDIRVLSTFLIFLVVALALQSFTGLTGIISFAHIGFMALGAYVAAILTTAPAIKLISIPDAPDFLVQAQLGFLTATAIAVAVTMLVAFVIGIPLVRLDGAPAAVATIGVLVIVNTVLANSGDLTRGAQAFYGIPRYTTPFVALGAVILVLLVARLFRDSNTGLGLRSSREDSLGSEASGVEVTRSRLVAWTLSAGMAAAGGSLYAHYVQTILPGGFMFDLTLVIMTMIIVGGPTVSGAVLGAMIVSIVTEFLRRAENDFSAPGLSTVVLGVLILMTMILRPSGLVGRWETDVWLRSRWERRTRRRERRGPGDGEQQQRSVQERTSHRARVMQHAREAAARARNGEG